MLFGEPFEVIEDGEAILFRFAVNPSKFTRDRIKSCGFAWDKERRAYVRKNNHNGKCAAEYLRTQLEETYGNGTL